MTDKQLETIADYYVTTPKHLVPPWVYGLWSVAYNRQLNHDSGLEWDYGLLRDQELLVQHRYAGHSDHVELPFQTMSKLWEILRERRDILQLSANPVPRAMYIPALDSRWVLCPAGPLCDVPGCRAAHGLCELRAPNEAAQLQPDAWTEGVDRWFGQAMRPSQLHLIRGYLGITLVGEVPAWVDGLMLQIGGEEVSHDSLLQWDFGLSLDQEILCANRGGGVPPFETMYELWNMLGQRRKRFEAEEEDETMAVQQLHWAER